MKAHSLKGDILSAKRDFAGAIAEYRTVLNEEPRNILIFLSLARAHLSNNEPGLAEETYKKVLDINPKVRQARLRTT